MAHGGTDHGVPLCCVTRLSWLLKASSMAGDAPSTSPDNQKVSSQATRACCKLQRLPSCAVAALFEAYDVYDISFGMAGASTSLQGHAMQLSRNLWREYQCSEENAVQSSPSQEKRCGSAGAIQERQ